MTNDDICGAECADGTPCEHPAGSCPVPSHSEPEAENPQGRGFTLGEADHENILDAAREGLSKAGCARAAGVSHSQLTRYLEANGEFRSAFRRARRQGETELVRGGLHDGDVDSSMAKFLLSTSFGYVKTEKRELEHDTAEGSGFEFNVVFSDDEGDDGGD